MTQDLSSGPRICVKQRASVHISKPAVGRGEVDTGESWELIGQLLSSRLGLCLKE